MGRTLVLCWKTRKTREYLYLVDPTWCRIEFQSQIGSRSLPWAKADSWKEHWHRRNDSHQLELPRKHRLRNRLQKEQETKKGIWNVWRKEYEEENMPSSAEGLIEFGLNFLAWGTLDPVTQMPRHVCWLQESLSSCRALSCPLLIACLD